VVEIRAPDGSVVAGAYYMAITNTTCETARRVARAYLVATSRGASRLSIYGYRCRNFSRLHTSGVVCRRATHKIVWYDTPGE
jgi:hypothetical protein